MLSRSGLSIRKFIPHRRFSVSDNQEDMSGAERKSEDTLPWTDQDDGGDVHAVYKRSSRKRRAPVPIIATSPLTHSDILRPLPPLPSETPRSSASSSCRCERHAECDCPLLSWKRRSPLYSISSRGDNEDSTLESSAYSYGADEALARRIPRSRFHLSGDSGSQEDDVARPLSLDGKHKEKRSNDGHVDKDPCQELSKDLQQFMQEADDAFKAIGSTISEVHSTQNSISQNTKPNHSDTEPDLEPTPPTPPPKEIAMSLSKSPSEKVLSTFSPAPESPPKGNTPTNFKRKSKTFKQTRSMKPQRKPAAPKQAVKNGPRWTLSESVSELLTGNLFHKIEADEMLTPDQIEAYKQRRLTKLQAEKSAEALENDSADTPIEPFHLDDLPLRIGSSGVKTDFAANAEEKLAISSSQDVVQPNFTFDKRNTNPMASLPTKKPPGKQTALNDTNTTPTPPSRHLRSASRKQITELPSIPEAITTPRPIDEYVYLQSSPCSMTTPTFRHGPIRLPKSDLVPDMKLGADDGLDWTAFQMAILGGAGDWFSDSDDTLRRREAEDIADIREWWDSWHFESTGDLLTHDCGASSPTSTLSGDEIPDISYNEIESDTLYRPHHIWQEVPHKSGAKGLQLDLDHAKGKRTPSHYFPGALVMDDRWRRDSEQKQVINRESTNSLPPSPMLDLRVIRSDDGDDLDVVPMGYNLGHDLGDFLKWEAEHAYAGDFNSPSSIM